MLDHTSAQPTRTQATEASYRNTYFDLRHIAERDARAGGDLFEVVDWFCSKHNCWSSSTIRQYKAALSFTVRTTERLHPDQSQFLMMRLRRGPDARHSGPRRTAARKRKSLPYAEWILLMQTVRNSISPDDHLLLCFLIFGPALFLRPRLARVCKRCGVRRVSLYTLRRVGIATAKAWMTPAEVAAAAGHASTRTAPAHYAKRRHGWGDVRLAGLPTAASIQAVRQVGNPRFDQRLPSKASRQLPR